MDQTDFDQITRMFAIAGSRRQAVGALLGIASLAGEGFVGQEEVAAARCRTVSERRAKRMIRRAARRYGQSYKIMLRVAKCESNLDNCAVNTAGPWYGLFQFSAGTWEWTPYRNKDWYNPRYNALAAGWMWKHYDRRDHWTCQ
jgi:hypothetical protein